MRGNRVRRIASLALSTALVATACGGGGGFETTGFKPRADSGLVASSSPLKPLEVATTADVEYAASRLLDVYAPTGPGRWPVVVVVHGLSQRRGTFAPLAETLAANGAVVFNISTIYSVPPIDAIEDIACAIRFARASASKYGGDPAFISIVGNSSGAAKGSIVAMDGDAYVGDCVVTDGSALPDALVGYEGPFDYATHLYGTFAVPQIRQEDPDMWKAVDPYSHIGGNRDLVVRLVHGLDDDTQAFDVPPEVSAGFHDSLAEAGYDVELTYVDGASHGALRPGTDAYEVIVQYVLDVIR